ncbi:MAG: hypothetical protein D6704_08920 [Nitrospirae bacterium]|nr:MAG: hypothetical protein D6704_08920 [Nitrospirota bacterium]
MRFVVWLLALIGMLGWSHIGWTAGQQLDIHDGSAITITAPENGATVGSSFPLRYELRKGLKADHAHVYLDGKYQKGFKGMFHNVSPGRHTITVKVATKDHDMLPISDSVEVTVK